MPEVSVSVALPVKNGLPHLKQAIGGLCRQTYRNFSLFVQDSVSTDGSLEYLRSLDTFFPVHIVSEPDGSLVAGYNRALQRCTGDLVIAAACDEVLDDDAIEHYVDWHEEHPQAVFIYSGMRLDYRDGTPLRDYQPLRFDLIDYLRHRMCPTTAGAFKRRILLDELRLDETLKTVPDFELFTRIGLRFGAERIVCKQRMTATARADAASLTFRPETYRQISRDKTTIIQRLMPDGRIGRLLNRGIANEFWDFLKRDVLCEMHVSFARHVYELAGYCPEFREQVIAARGYMRMNPAMAELALNNRHLMIGQESGTLEFRPHVPPEVPPADQSEVVATFSPHLMEVHPVWAACGASQDPCGETNVVTTSADPWNYAIWLRPDLSGLEFDRYWYWLKVRVARAEGQPLLGLHDPVQDSLSREIEIPAGDRDVDFYFDLGDDEFHTLLLRNGSVARKSVVEFKAFDLVRMPIKSESDT